MGERKNDSPSLHRSGYNLFIKLLVDVLVQQTVEGDKQTHADRRRNEQTDRGRRLYSLTQSVPLI